MNVAKLRALFSLAGIAFKADPRASLVTATALPFEFAGGALQALALKALTDASLGHDLRGVWVAGALLALLAAGRDVASTGWSAARLRLGERAGMVMQRHLAELTASIPTIEHFERPDYLRRLDLVRQDSGWLTDLFAALVHHVSRIGRLALAVGLLAALHPALILLPLFAIPTLLATARAQAIRRRLDEAIAEPRRLETHLQNLAWNAASGKEMRVFGLGDELLRRHVRTRAIVDRLELRGQVDVTLVSAAGWFFFAVGFVGAIAFVVAEAAAGSATVGDVVLALTLASQVNGSVADLAGTAGWAARSLTVAERYLWLTDYARQAVPTTLDRTPVPDSLKHGITLEDISFTYPGTDKQALQEVSLHFPAGSTVALVGENGAGKTTLVKLLCGLYLPTTGRVLVDGVNLKELDVVEWRRRTSAGFQDFSRFMLLVRESVGIGEVPRVEDGAAVMAALDRAHADDVVSQLPWGLETQLGRYFRQDVNRAQAAGLALSDGQWQKLALGRAMMRKTPLLLVLDEPTASLDAPSEHALFERYAGAARRTASQNGGVTVLVSHRFSTARMADLIVVMEKGQVISAGSHAALMAGGGLYPELYELQARAYRA